MVETNRDIEVADGVRLHEEARKDLARYSEVQRIVEFLNVEKSKLLAQMERKQKLRIGALGGVLQTSIFQDVLGQQDLGDGE